MKICPPGARRGFSSPSWDASMWAGPGRERSKMRFGLFGGARSRGGGPQGDSSGYRDYIDYVREAERLGFESVFIVEHHFTGFGQVSASLNILSYLAGMTETIRLGT